MFPGQSFSYAANKLGKDELWQRQDNIISVGGTIHSLVCQLIHNFFELFRLGLFHKMGKLYCYCYQGSQLHG